VTYTLSRPPGWSDDLSFCLNKPIGREAKGPGLPAGCAVTDLLIGRKATNVGTLTGESLVTLDGKRAIKQVDKQPRSSLAARIYTFVVYDAQGASLFGFSTSIGVGTPAADQEAITHTLDAIAGSVTVRVPEGSTAKPRDSVTEPGFPADAREPQATRGEKQP
jgi:hypothetical protein